MSARRRREAGSLGRRFTDHWRSLAVEARAPLIVAVSGGVDSLTLLHLLRFEVDLPAGLHVAHFDHAWRDGSDGEARWVAGVARAWGLECSSERAVRPPGDEDEARGMRYAFLEDVRARLGARWVLTAHHADDQAETVLFRALRGAGPGGLVGIPTRREPWLRPLLPFWREEIEQAARVRGLRWLEDPSNRALSRPRSVLRHRILPDLERSVAPGARRALVRLARLAGEGESALREWTARADREARAGEGPTHVEWSLEALRALDPHLAGRVLREGAAGLGVRLDERSTRRARAALDRERVRFHLPGELDLTVWKGRLRLERTGEAAEADRPLTITGAGEGEGEVVLGGVRWRVGWSDRAGVDAPVRVDLAVRDLPVVVRARRPGDRLRLPAGSRPLKKLLQEAGIARSERGRLPLVADARGRVLWALGLGASVCAEAPDAGRLHLGFESADRR